MEVNKMTDYLDRYPRNISDRIKGPIEEGLRFAFTLAGLGLGFKIGCDACNYVNHLAQVAPNLGVLEMLVKTNPLLTKIAMSLGMSYLGDRVAREIGNLGDIICRTYRSD
jgi:hypothetical protein